MQLDAHSDTWTSEDYNHGTMFYHAAKEGIIDAAHSIRIGIRTPNPDARGLTTALAGVTLAWDILNLVGLARAAQGAVA